MPIWKVRLIAVSLFALYGAPATALAAAGTVTGFVAVTTGTGSKQISAFSLDGSHERRLTTGPADHHYPSLAPDGRRLLYVGNDGDRDEIYTLDLAVPTSAPREVTSPPLVAESPTWAPDGRTIAFSAILLGRTSFQIFTAPADGSRLIQITHDTTTGSSQPVFSPDGKHIAYINGRAGADQIWVMNADGSGARPLTSGPLDAYPAWLDNATVMFARDIPSTGHSVVVGVGLGGIERVLSPDGVSLVEPRPLPDGRAYGATERVEGGLRLVTVSRSDAATLDSPGEASFQVSPISVAASDGSVFTMDWIVAPPMPPNAPASLLPFLVSGIGLGALGLALWAGRRGTLRKN